MSPVTQTTTSARPRLRVPTPAERQVLNRFSYGCTPALYRQCRNRGGALKWFEWQLEPGRIKDDYANSMRSWFPVLEWSYKTLDERRDSGEISTSDPGFDLARWTLLRRIYSKRQLHEVMTEFWSNLLHVPATDSKSWRHRITYDSTIRRHALGRFDQLLNAAIVHPAMLLYLDNSRSIAKNPNENLGRELLELHTVGRIGGYDEVDVRNSALILTGWRVATGTTWEPYYSTVDHHVGPVTVLGFSDANPSADGRRVTRDYLHYLAHHPATARRIAQRLAVRFVSDNPPLDLVNRLANVYLSSGTDIRPVLRALSLHPAFRDSVGSKVRTPTEDLVATYRILGVKALKPSGASTDLVHTVLSQARAMGQLPFQWPRPDGFPDINDAWTGVSRMLGSWRVHLNIAVGQHPSTAVVHRPPSRLLPALPARFDFVVDHLARSLIARPASQRLIDTCCIISDIRSGERITRDHALVRGRLPRVIAAVLDTPAHMTR